MMECYQLTENLDPSLKPQNQSKTNKDKSASHYQLGTVISQDNHPIAFYSHKLQPAQVRYTTRERELHLIIKSNLKGILKYPLGQHIVVYTDHQNLTHKNFNTEHIMQ
jgi:hypothetical protein